LAESDSNLDACFLELRAAVEDEIIAARKKRTEEFSRVLNRLRAAATEAEWQAALEESEHRFEGDTPALEFLNALAAALASAAPKAPVEHDQQELQLRAKRFARVKVAELQLYQAAEVKAGRTMRDLYGALGTQIDGAREAFRERFLTRDCVDADYLHAELVRTLANDDASLLGPGYPGPLV